VVHVWRSASKSGDTKTPQSERSLVLPRRAITALTAHEQLQDHEREAAGKSWHGTNLGHKSTHVTETVYRHVIRPTIRGGATVMDNVFDDDGDD
jgi:hypothetical protein